ncbi:MAG: SIR2 family NAD-dependent protein deacylase [Streptosporangiaceae bacterium]
MVVGSGISLAASGQAPTASWLGLLQSGIKRAATFNSNLPSDWKEHILKELEYAEENDYLPDLLSVAEKITTALGGKEGGELKAWLREDIGTLHIDQHGNGRELIEAISELGLPLTTTNYDTLLETVLTRSAVTWQDSSAAQLIAQGAIPNILHLHGVWEHPESIVFGSTSYGELLANSAAQAIERIIAGGSSLLFVGCGAGLSDPNFVALRGWLTDLFSKSETRHYRLCNNQELKEFAKTHEGERILPVSYGESYTDLLPFIRDLAPQDTRVEAGSKAVTTIQQLAVDALQARVRSETIMAEYFADVDSRMLDAILIPPVLLPVTQEQFAQSGNLEADLRPKRCDPKRDVSDNSCLLIAATETAGLTSTLEWIVVQAHRNDTSLTPVIVDFRQLGNGHRPLERQIRKELRAAGIDLQPADPLPRLAVALDNLAIKPDKIFSRALDELRSDACSFVSIGCREGAEAPILEALEKTGFKPALRYVGRLNNRDATKIATLVEPTRADRLASKAILIAKNEHLPRTPLTIGLLVCMLLHGEALLSTASATALLDAWVNLLLGRGDPHDDARFSLDSLEKADILAFLAERFVQARAGSLSEAVAVNCLIEYFAEVGWSEDPIEVLGNFRNRYLLTVRNGQVSFAQSSYLHLFAAKRAIESEDFRSALYEDPLYFSPILRHYAALTRNDASILRRVEDLLTPAETTGTPSTGGSFSDAIAEDGDISATSIEDLMEQLSLSGSDSHTRTGQEDDNDSSSAEEPESEEDEEDWLDRMDDGDREPFPLEDIEDAAPAIRIMAALTLVSNVLRDSELVKDLELKERVLRRTLLIWGKFVDLLSTDENLTRFWEILAYQLSEAFGVPEESRPGYADLFCEMAPVLVGYNGISQTLSSRKLLRSLDSCFEDKSFIADTPGSVMGALLGYDIHASGWPKYFSNVQQRHGRVRAVRSVLRRLAEAAYYDEHLNHRDSEGLLNFIVAQYVQRIAPASAMERKRHENRIAQKIRQNRMLIRSRNGALGGERALGEIEAPTDEN